MPSPLRASYPAVYAILAGGLVAGILDITYAIVAYGATGVPSRVILQSVASGWLGKGAYSGGWPVAALGLASHLALTCIMAAVFVAAARRFSPLRARPLAMGALFGLAVFAAMNYVVVPLSAAAVQPPRGVFLAGGLLAHVFLVGIPIAFFARRVPA
jgi:uncharacterized membrane protein YagU involved in acid resistance